MDLPGHRTRADDRHSPAGHRDDPPSGACSVLARPGGDRSAPQRPGAALTSAQARDLAAVATGTHLGSSALVAALLAVAAQEDAPWRTVARFDSAV